MSDELFQPTLQDQREAMPLYSTRATFLTSFFGGPFAAGIILFENARRIGFWKRALALLLLGVVVWVGILWHYLYGRGQGDLGARNMRLVGRLVALAMWGAVTWLHRESQRATDLMGVERPNGWGLGLGAVVIGAAATFVLVAASPNFAEFPGGG